MARHYSERPCVTGPPVGEKLRHPSSRNHRGHIRRHYSDLPVIRRYSNRSRLSESTSSSDYCSGESDEDSDYETLEGFRLDKLSVIESDNETVDESANDTSGSPAARLTTPGLGRDLLHIVSSKYRDDSLLRNDTVWTNMAARVAAEIDSIAIPAGSTVKLDPLYRWLHLDQERMEFDDFHSISCSLPGLTDTDHEHISWVLGRAQKDFIEPFVDRKGIRGRVVKPVLIRKAIKKQTGTRDTYTFMNFPFFRLQRYLAPNVGEHDRLHHIRPLMQTRHPSVAKQRDLQQAIGRISGTPQDACFHVAGFWCLVISDKYLVTYSRGLDMKQLCGDLITLNCQPPNQAPNAKPSALQILHAGELYLVPFEKCSTWFNLTQLFYEVTYRFDDVAQVFWKNREVGPTRWTSVIKQARQRPQRVVIQWRSQSINRALLKVNIDGLDGKNELSETASEQKGHIQHLMQPEGKGQTGAPQDLLRPSSPNASGSQIAQFPPRSPSATPISMESYLEIFQILRWIAVQRSMAVPAEQHISNDTVSPNISLESAPTRKTYDQQTKQFLDDLSKMMSEVQDPSKRTLYKNCPSKTLDEVKKALTGITRIDAGEKEVVAVKKNLLSAAILAFQAFLPLDQQGTICSKYWGSLHRSITATAKASGGQQKKALRIVEKLSEVAKKAMQTQHQLSHGRGPNPHELKLPAHFIRAWYYLLRCILEMTWTPEANQRAWKYALKFETELKAGYDFVFGEDDGRRLRECRAVMPADMPAFLVQRLVEGIDGNIPSPEKACWGYFGQLEAQLTEDPLDPSHQVNASLLLDEIQALQHHKNQQWQILYELYESVPLETRVKLKGFHDRSQDRAIEDISKLLIRTMQGSLGELRDKALRSVSASKENIERNKDHRDAAIYVFTIVTIIFLPLSTVSSIFGMNTRDVRNMGDTQWLFWATAIPVTIVTVLVSLVGAGAIRVRGQKLTFLGWKSVGAMAGDHGPAPAKPMFPPPSPPMYILPSRPAGLDRDRSSSPVSAP